MNQTDNILLFDGVCNLCNGLVLFIIRRDKKEKLKFASLQSDIGKSLLEKFNLSSENTDTIVYIHHGQYFLKSTAILFVFKELGSAWKYLYVFIIIPEFIRDFIYNIFAKTRYALFGKRKSCMIPSPDVRHRFLDFISN